MPRAVLIGGGARSKTWWHVVQRLSGRAILIPDATDLVAIGAAVQAAATLHSLDPREVASRWNTTSGTLLEPVPRDVETITRHRSVRHLALDAVRPPRVTGSAASTK